MIKVLKVLFFPENFTCPSSKLRDRSFFMRWGGAGGIGGGAMQKKLALKGGPAKKIWSVRGGHSKNYLKMLQ